MSNKWGFLRETTDAAIKAGLDADTGLHRTGLNEYLAVIFPDTNDWIHDKALGEVNGEKFRNRPDYRSESLKLIVEFDGLPHYNSPETILKDKKNTELYQKLGYKVVRIPYFIQLTNKAVKTLFSVNVREDLFDERIPSLGEKNKIANPGFLCPLGLERMARDFKNFPEQYAVNIASLKKAKTPELTGVSFLEKAYIALDK